MRLTILTQYFPPEVGAPQNRLYELAVRLQKQGFDITILTAMPNYPSMEIHSAYRNKWMVKEEMDGLKIIRSWIYVSKNKGFIHRILNYYSFAISSFIVGLFSLRSHDYLLCESPPLFLGKTGWLLSFIFNARFIFNVSDLWPESAEKLGIVKNKTILGIATLLEEFLYNRSYIVTGQTQGIVKDIQKRLPHKKVYWLPNGVDISLYVPEKNDAWRKNKGFEKDDFLCLYAGIIGYAQGLEIILQAANETRNQSNIKYLLVGSGPEKEKLIQLKSELNLTQVYFFDAVKKPEMKSILSSVDAAIIPLRKLDLFLGAIPSKIFENLAMKVPVILGVDGEARDLFEKDGKCVLYAEPENHKELAEKIRQLEQNPSLREQLTTNGYTYVSEKFNRDIISAKFCEYLNSQ